MRDEGAIYVAEKIRTTRRICLLDYVKTDRFFSILNRRCTRLPGCIRLRNDLYCVEWGVELYSLTHSLGY